MTTLRCCSAAATPASSAARLFVQLSCARHSGGAATFSTSASASTLAPASSILDVLLPPTPPRPFHRHLTSTSTSTSNSNSSSSSSSTDFGGRRRGTIVPGLTTSRHTASAITPARTRPTSRFSSQTTTSAAPRHHHGSAALLVLPFSTTAARRNTRTIYNPQRDEEGNEMVLEITPRAANRLSHLMAQDRNPDLALRIQVEPGGCHGFQYLMSVTTLPPIPSPPTSTSSTPPPPPPPPPASDVAAEVAPSTTTSAGPAEETPALREDDTVFAFVADSDGKGQGGPEAKIVLDGPSLELLKGSKVDYTMELIGSQFKIVDNPHATSSCGCGTSFDIKDLGL